VTKIKLTDKETLVLKALAKNAMDTTSGDFGCMDDTQVEKLKKQLGAKAFGGLVTNLQDKGLVAVHEPLIVNESDRVQQYTLGGEGWTLAGYDASKIG